MLWVPLVVVVAEFVDGVGASEFVALAPSAGDAADVDAGGAGGVAADSR